MRKRSTTRRPESADAAVLDFFEEIAHLPQAWYYSAETLFGSAEYILAGLQHGPAAKRSITHGHMDTHYNSYGLLLGCALECILKGLWVAHRHAVARNGRLLRIRGVGDHDLLALARAVGVTLSAKEKAVIDRLSYWVKTAGRYPVPVRAIDMQRRGQVKPGCFTAAEWDIARQTTNRLLDELRDQMY
jgi:hypothetical protein